MIYARHIPSPPLSAYIDELYYVESPAPYHHPKILLMPTLHFMVNFGGAFQVFKPDQTEAFATCTEIWWVGPWSSYHTVDCPLALRFFGVHFKPGGAYPFLHLPLSELHNQVVPAETLWGLYAAEIRERLDAAPTIQAAFARFEQLLLSRLGEAPAGLDVVHYAVGEIARHRGALSIRALSDQIGISQNHLGAQFKRLVGIPPKELARFHRFAHVLRSLDQTQPVDWTLIAHQAGFYDQSHFNKDFVAFTGHSPTRYLRQRCPMRVETPKHGQDFDLRPID